MDDYEETHYFPKHTLSRSMSTIPISLTKHKASLFPWASISRFFRLIRACSYLRIFPTTQLLHLSLLSSFLLLPVRVCFSHSKAKPNPTIPPDASHPQTIPPPQPHPCSVASPAGRPAGECTSPHSYIGPRGVSSSASRRFFFISEFLPLPHHVYTQMCAGARRLCACLYSFPERTIAETTP